MRNFTAEDFAGYGQYLVRMGASELDVQKTGKVFQGYSNTGYLSTIMYKVGYHTNNLEIGNGEQLVCLVSMSDGYVDFYHYPNAGRGIRGADEWEKVIWQATGEKTGWQVLADFLTTGTEEFRFATQEELVRVVMYQSSRWKG